MRCAGTLNNQHRRTTRCDPDTACDFYDAKMRCRIKPSFSLPADKLPILWSLITVFLLSADNKWPSLADMTLALIVDDPKTTRSSAGRVNQELRFDLFSTKCLPHCEINNAAFVQRQNARAATRPAGLPAIDCNNYNREQSKV